MGICDLCNAPGGAGSKTYTCADFRTLVRAGLRPDSSVFSMGEIFGMSQKESEAGWVQQVMSDATNWMLCSECVSKAARFGG